MRLRPPSAENGWLLFGYLVWVLMIWAIWQIVAGLILGPG